jgi:hypothetical protein
MRYLGVVACVLLSACATRKPAQVVPAPTPDEIFREHVRRFKTEKRIAGYVMFVSATPRQMDGSLAKAWRVDSDVYLVLASNVWLAQATAASLLETAAHEVCHISLGHSDLLADRIIDPDLLNHVDSRWHRDVYRCVVELIGEELFCRALTDGNYTPDTAACREYLRKIGP